MAEYKQTKILKQAVAAYIAGLIDGEGTITLSRRHANEHRQLVVSIANTELALLEFVINHVGTDKITRKRTISDSHTASYCYSISNRQAFSLIEQVTPYLHSHKKLRAQLILQHYKDTVPRNGKYTETMLKNRAKFEQAFFAITSRTAR